MAMSTNPYGSPMGQPGPSQGSGGAEKLLSLNPFLKSGLAGEGYFSPLGKFFMGDPRGDLMEFMGEDRWGVGDTVGKLQRAEQAAMDPRRSVSGRMLAEGLRRNQAQQTSLAAGAPASQQAAARRMAAQMSSKMGGELSGNAALAGMIERQRALNALAGFQGALRGQDFGLYGQQFQAPSSAESGLGFAGGIAKTIGFGGLPGM